MEIEFMAEFTEGMSRDRALQIIKGKRTKRQRPCSPFGTSTTSDSSNNNCLIENSTPAVSSDQSTKEDEDMANCLILLAQSVYDHPVKEKENGKEKEISDEIRRKSGLYVYECKTCNRSFPSFQALGGHRASHKKPKVHVEEKRTGTVQTSLSSDQHVEEDDAVEEEENKASIIGNNVQKSASIQTGVVNSNVNNTKVKVHECSICGSEFLSGQALGGHMRKHRPIPPTVNRTMNNTNTDTDDDSSDRFVTGSSNGILSLDLNFPPPEESKFQFTAGSSQQRMVFSAPAFVDCRY